MEGWGGGGVGSKVCKVNQHATIHLYTSYLACLHQNLCLCPALFLQMDLKLHLKITKIYKILAVQACKQADEFCSANNNINVLQPSWTVGVSQKVIPRESLMGCSFFLPTTSAPLVFQLLSRWRLQFSFWLRSSSRNCYG